MNDIATTLPQTIRARIHESAIRRVTRIYASTISDVLIEALQNSRRAGASELVGGDVPQGARQVKMTWDYCSGIDTLD